MSGATGPECGELVALRQGVHSVQLPTGETRLLAYPHAESFGPLDAGQLAVLRGLAEGPRSRAGLVAVWRSAAGTGPADGGTDTDADGAAGGEAAVAPLLGQLRAGGWLDITVTSGDHPLHTLRPRRAPPPPPKEKEKASGGDLVLSRFAVVRRDGDGLVVESPRAWCDVRVHDPAALVVLGRLTGTGRRDAAARAGLPAEATERIRSDLRWAGLAVPAAEEAAELRLARWGAHELWFHERSRLGDRGFAGFGGTWWAADRFDAVPARHEPYPGPATDLARPELDTLRHADPTLTSVLEDRGSVRDHDDRAPLTADQLGEFLYRCARTRSTAARDGVGFDDRPYDERQYDDRPYPSGGAAYELELYPVVRHMSGLAPGMYHYDPHEHRLRLVRPPAHPAVRRLLRTARWAAGTAVPPQVLVVVAGRVGRVLWKYEAIGYALTLKHVGVLFQTMYLVATAMGLAACGLGAGDVTAFAAATGQDPLVETSVGEFTLGSRAATGATDRTGGVGSGGEAG